MNKVIKGSFAFILVGWLGIGAVEAMAGTGFCPPIGPAHGRAGPPAAAFRGPVRPYLPPMAYRSGPRPMPVAWAPRPVPAWGAPQLARNAGWARPAWAYTPPYRQPYPMAAGLAQRPYPVQPQMAYSMGPAQRGPFPQQAYRQVHATEPSPGRHWMAAR